MVTPETAAILNDIIERIKPKVVEAMKKDRDPAPPELMPYDRTTDWQKYVKNPAAKKPVEK